MIKHFIDDQIMQSILSGLIDQVKSKIDLNLDYLKKRCKEEYGIEKIEGVEQKDGNIVVYKDQIACKMNYEVRFPVSVLITTKEKVNSSLSQNNDTRSEIDVLSKGLGDSPKEFDDLLEEDDDMAPELDDFLEEDDDMAPELDDFLEEDDDIAPELDDLLEEDNDIAPELDLEDLEPENDEIDEPIAKTHASGGY